MATRAIYRGRGAAKGAKYACTVVNRCRVEASTRWGMTLSAESK